MSEEPASRPQEDPGSPRRPLLARSGALFARHPWATVAVWLVALVLSGALYPSFVSSQSALSYTVNGSESEQVKQELTEEFPELGSERDAVVFHSERLTARDPAFQRSVRRVLTRLDERDDVRRTLSPEATGQISEDGHTAVGVAALDPGGNLRDTSDALQKIARDTGNRAVEGYFVGYSTISAEILEKEAKGASTAESIGIPLALLVLLLVTGALVAMAIPLVMAAIGVVLAYGVLGAVGLVTTLDGIVGTIVLMIGLGVGIDYALFITTRFREELSRRRAQVRAEGGDPDARPDRSTVQAVVATTMTFTGRTILYSGVIVILCLLTLLMVNARTFQQLALGAALAVACAVLATQTLLPALFGLLRHRIESGGMPWRRKMIDIDTEGEGRGLLGRWARTVMRRPVLIGLLSTAVLVVLALPTLGMRLGIDLGVSALDGTRVGTGHQLVSQQFSPGSTMPLDVVYRSQDGPLDRRDLREIERFTTSVRKTEGVAEVAGPRTATGGSGLPSPAELRESPLVSEDGRSFSLTVVPSVPPDSTEAMDLVERLRDDVAPDVLGGSAAEILVGGPTAEFVDISDEASDKLWWVIGAILVLSFLFLTVVFRSLLLPLKAIVMNLLATGAAYGVLVWVFQEGHLESQLGFTSSGTIQVYLPLVAFALLFGLSMDYEVFLVGRIQESWRRTGDNEHAVAVGLEHTALAISAAAAIMVAVFGSFIAVDILEMKQIGLGLAAAIFLDATLVRIVLVPAVMRLAGRANWWLPGPLDRRLPTVKTE